jgi:Tol biopolymer transport system component
MRRFVVFAILASACALSALPAGAKVAGSNGRIAFSRFDSSVGDTVTYVVSPDGHKLRLFFPGRQTGLPRWSPDGSRLALLTGLNNPCPPCAASTIILNPDTGGDRVLSPPDPNLSTNCSIWSPDARRFACEVENLDGTRNGIYTIRTSDGRGLTQITSSPGGNDVPIDYSPDGKQIVFGRDGEEHSCTAKSALYVVNVDGSGLRPITPPGFCDDDGSWSPDGTTIVFGVNGSLYTVHPDGTKLRKISLRTGRASIGLNAFDAGWSPDGSKIVFSLVTRTGTREGIATANADGSDVQMITNSPTIDSKADWGPSCRGGDSEANTTGGSGPGCEEQSS